MTADPPALLALLARMTLAEKLGQLSLHAAEAPAGGFAANPLLRAPASAAREADIRAGRIGGIFNLADRAAMRALQDIAVHESRLGIPLVFAADVIHGFETIFPIPLAEAAAFDPDLARRTAAAAAREASAAGIDWTFAPAMDLCRDPRWGRYEETSGEDVVLTTRLAMARVEGFQGDDPGAQGRVLATAKHFAAYGAPVGGRDYEGASLGPRALADHYLPPFEGAVRAGVGAVMTAFNEIDGVPATANRALLTGTLREAWGFDGLILSDYASDAEVIAHGIAADGAEAARACLEAGLDMNMESALYRDHVAALIEAGAIDPAVIDRAVLRVLRLKHRLGLFADPWRRLGPAVTPIDRDAIRALSLEAATRAPVLLTNANAILPLRPGVRVAVIGPLGDEAARDRDGPWSLFASGEGVGLRAALRARLGAGRVVAPMREGAPADLEADLAAARASDLAILVLGEDARQSGESRSRVDIGLPPGQIDWARRLRALGVPFVALVRCGRPLCLTELVELADAVMITWFLGPETGPALAALVTGDVAPRGHLPASLPRHGAQVPIHYDAKPTGRAPAPGGDDDFRTRFIDLEAGPLFPFGHGLTYAEFVFRGLSLSSPTLAWDGSIEIAAMIENVGPRPGSALAQLYVRDLVASVTRPVRELKDFAWVTVEPGSAARVVFTLRREDLVFTGLDLVRRAEPGRFQVWIAPDAHGGVSDTFILDGPRD